VKFIVPSQFSQIRKDDKIKPAKLNSYFSFMRGAKSANSELFKDCYVEKYSADMWE
jgi:hypothetical protein